MLQQDKGEANIGYKFIETKRKLYGKQRSYFIREKEEKIIKNKKQIRVVMS